MKEKYRNSKTELEYTQDGDGMKVSVMNSAFPGKKSEFKFQYGKEFSGAGMDDSTFTVSSHDVCFMPANYYQMQIENALFLGM